MSVRNVKTLEELIIKGISEIRSDMVVPYLAKIVNTYKANPRIELDALVKSLEYYFSFEKEN